MGAEAWVLDNLWWIATLSLVFLGAMHFVTTWLFAKSGRKKSDD